VDAREGVDVVIHRAEKYGFPDFSHSRYLNKRSRLGTDQQIKEWIDQSKALLDAIV